MAAVEKTANPDSVFTRGRAYISESFDELKKVNRPTRQETLQATMVAIFIMLFVSFCLFLLDMVFSRIMLAIIA